MFGKSLSSVSVGLYSTGLSIVSVIPSSITGLWSVVSLVLGSSSFSETTSCFSSSSSSLSSPRIMSPPSSSVDSSSSPLMASSLSLSLSPSLSSLKDSSTYVVG